MNIKKSFLILSLLLICFFNSSEAQETNHKYTVHGHNSFELLVNVFNRETQKPVDDVLLYLYEMPSNELVATKSTIRGTAVFFIDPEKEYTVETCKRLYLNAGINIFNCHDEGSIFCINGASSFDFTSGGGADKPNAFLNAQLAIDSVAVGKTFKLDNVYYDLGKANLRYSSKKELNKLYNILNQFPSMVVELSSHTDVRGSSAFNDKLSSNRANSCYNYLTGKGISPRRIIPVGYGETRTVNECFDGVSCSESEHQLNRRTEFTILSFEGVECEEKQGATASAN